jgi:hypothetical protein
MYKRLSRTWKKAPLSNEKSAIFYAVVTSIMAIRQKTAGAGRYFSSLNPVPLVGLLITPASINT